MPSFAGIPHRIGFKGECRIGVLNDVRTLDRAHLPRLVDRYFSLGGDAPAPSPALHTTETTALCARLALSQNERALVLCPGAEYGPAKQWPLSHYASIAQHASAIGMAVWILGGPKDRIAGETIKAAVPGVHNLAGKTTLPEAADLIHTAKAVVTNDSGLMHVAAAVGTPLVALFGSSSPSYTPPLSQKARTLSLELACSPCFKRECPLGHTHCLTELGPELVIHALRDLVGAEHFG